MLLTAPLPRYLDQPYPAQPVAVPKPDAPAPEPSTRDRFQTRVRLYRMAGWSRLASVWTVIRHWRE